MKIGKSVKISADELLIILNIALPIIAYFLVGIYFILELLGVGITYLMAIWMYGLKGVSRHRTMILLALFIVSFGIFGAIVASGLFYPNGVVEKELGQNITNVTNTAADHGYTLQ